MPRFDVTIDRKGTIWLREHWRINAETKEQAEKAAIQHSQFYDNYEDGDVECEYLFDTFEPMSVQENFAMANSESLGISDDIDMTNYETIEIIKEQ